MPFVSEDFEYFLNHISWKYIFMIHANVCWNQQNQQQKLWVRRPLLQRRLSKRQSRPQRLQECLEGRRHHHHHHLLCLLHRRHHQRYSAELALIFRHRHHRHRHLHRHLRLHHLVSMVTRQWRERPLKRSRPVIHLRCRQNQQKPSPPPTTLRLVVPCRHHLTICRVEKIVRS